MSYFYAIFLGLVQGIAEFLPISSSGHLSIFQHFLGLNNPEENNLLFDVLLHLGTLIAVFVAYRREIMDLLLELIAMLKREKSPMGRAAGISNRRMILLVILGTLPLFVILPIKADRAAPGGGGRRDRCVRPGPAGLPCPPAAGRRHGAAAGAAGAVPGGAPDRVGCG